MKRKLRLPAAFGKACEQSGIAPDQSLHSFISKNTLYAHLVRPPDTAHVLAAAVFDQWLKSRVKKPVLLTGSCREAAIACITKLLVLIRSQRGPGYKVNVYKRLIADWYAAAGQELPLVLETTDGLTIQLTQDFVLLCQLFGGTAAELLSFYAGRVCLTTEDADRFPGKQAAATGFFIQTSKTKKTTPGL